MHQLLQRGQKEYVLAGVEHGRTGARMLLRCFAEAANATGDLRQNRPLRQFSYSQMDKHGKLQLHRQMW